MSNQDNCTEEVHICNECEQTQCTGCPVSDMSTDCVLYDQDPILYNGSTVVPKNTILSTALDNIVQFTKTKISEIQNRLTLLNTGVGASIYSGDNLLGQKKIRKIKSSNGSVVITEGVDDINLTVATVDGSNTLINAGAGVTVLGNGTTNTPYIISATATSNVTKTSDITNDGENGTNPFLESIVLEDTDITLVLEGDESIGRFHNGETMTLQKGWTLEDYVTYIGRKSIPPIFLQPAISLSADNMPNNNREVGESLTLALTSTYTQNDGGLATAYSITKDNVSISGTTTASSSIVLTTTNVNYQATVNHNAGTGTKPDSLGAPVANTVGAGVKNSNTLSYRGYRAIFHGNSSAKQTTSTQVRTLTKRLENAGNVFNLTTGNTNRFFQFWLPTGINLTSVIDLDALNANITASYTSESLTVNNAGGEPVVGTLYTYSPDVPYSTNHSHQITIN